MGDRSDNQVAGLGLTELKLVDFQPAWASMYKAENKRLLQVPHVVAVEHIGSTAIPVIKAKPVIDIAMMVDVPPDRKDVVQALIKNGYVSHGEYGLPGRQFFTYGEPPVFHLHVVGPDSHLWASWIKLRDFLIQSPTWRKRYEDDKLRVMKLAAGNRKRYTELKAGMIREILLAAGVQQHE
jgi:GrpB-like predicted nucleotidyltransferase (UPF0157 family)